MVWRQEKVLRTNLQPNPSFRATSGWTTVRTNLAPNPDAVNVAGYEWKSNDGTYYPLVVDTTFGRTGNTSYVSNPVDGAAVVLSAYDAGGRPIPVTGGKQYTVSIYVAGTSTGVLTTNLFAGWLKSDGAASSVVSTSGPLSSLPSNKTWVRLSHTFTAPSDAGQMRVCVAVSKTSRVDTSDHAWIDNVLVEEGAAVLPYFDGASSNGSFDSNLESVWTGTANASPSVARGKAVTDWYYNTTSFVAWQGSNGQSINIRALVPANKSAVLLYTPSYAASGDSYSASITTSGVSSVYPQLSFEGGGTTLVPYLPPTGSSGTLTVSSPLPSGRSTVAFYLRTTSDIPVGTTVVASKFILEAAPQPGTYFDGSYPSATAGASYRWNGAAERSSSDMYIPALMSPPTNLWSSSSFGWAEPWLVDGMDIQSMAFGVETADATPPDLRGSHLSIPGMNGVYAQYNRSYEPGTIALKMWVLGCDVDGTLPGIRSARRQIFERNIRMLFRLFGYQGNTVTLSKTIYGDYEGATPIKVKARAIIDGFTSLDTMAARQRAELTVTMTLVDSFWADVNTTTDSTDASATMPKTLALSDVGTAPVDDSIITITGPITAPRVTCPASGSWIQYTGSVAAGQTLVIDTGAGTAKLNGNTSVLSSVTHGGTARFMVIPPRNSSLTGDTGFQTNLTLTGTGASSATKFSVAYNRKHLVIV